MTRIGALGAANLVEGFALAGAVVCVADDVVAVDAAWDTLPDDVVVLVLTAAAATQLTARLDERPQVLPVVVPE